MKLTFGDVLAQRDLDLTLLTRDRAALERPIAGAHAIEVALPSRWLPRDWIMLTNGLRLRGRADEQRRLVAELDENGQAALGWAVGLVLQRVPRAVIDEADRRGFPVFLVPIETPFRSIISFVNGSLLSDDLFAMRRVMSMQEFLMDALQHEGLEALIVERLAGMLDADVALLEPDGSVARAAGRTDAPALATALGGAGEDDGMLDVQAAGRRVLAMPVRSEGRLIGWLALALPRHALADRLCKPVLRSAAQLLGLVAHRRRLEAGDQRQKRAEVLAAALEPCSAQRATALDQHARELGVDVDGQASRVVVWGLPGGQPVPSSELAHELVLALEAGLDAGRLRHLLARTGGGITALVQGPLERIRAAVLPQAAREAGLRAGVSRTLTTLGDAVGASRDARVALEQAGEHGRPAVTAFDDLDPASWLLASCDRDLVAEKVSGLLDPLRGQPPLLDTLRVYFAANMNVAEAALRLTLHRNTLRYRLARIEELLGLRLDAPETIANLHMALLSARITGPGPAARDAGALRAASSAG